MWNMIKARVEYLMEQVWLLWGQITAIVAQLGRQVITVPDVYVDAIGGNDSNNGLTSGTAWRTNARLNKFLGVWSLIDPTGSVFTIHYVGGSPASVPPLSDPLIIQAVLAADANVVIDGSATLQTIRTGTLTGFVNTGAANNPPAPELEDTAAAALFAADVLHMHRIRMTSGAATGALFWAAKDLTGGVLRTGLSGTQLPSAGDEYVVEAFGPLYIGLCDLDCVGTGTTNSPSVIFSNIWMSSTSADFTAGFFPQGTTISYEAVGCIIQLPIIETPFFFAASCLIPIETSIGIGAVFEMGGGVSACLVATNGAQVGLDSGLTVQKMTNDLGTANAGIASIFGAIVQIGIAAVCDAMNMGGSFNTQGDGVFSGVPSIAFEQACGKIILVSDTTTPKLSGNGNTGYGWRVGPGGTDIALALPTLTGTTGDLILDNNHTTVFKFDPTVPGFTPANGAAVTWANITANFANKPRDPATQTAWIGLF